MMQNVPYQLARMQPFWGSWTLQEFLGRGGFGEVYRIQREDVGGMRQAALKWIHLPHSPNEIEEYRAEGLSNIEIKNLYRDIVTHLRAEIRLMQEMRGASNVVIYEDHMVQESDDGLGWDILIRMELLTPLNRWLSDERTVGDAIQVGIDICRALTACRQANIIHRDVKPDNILVSKFGEFKLGDFGVARQLENTLTNMSRQGTNPYIAPEVFRGEVRYDATVDVYSLGLVIYRLLNLQRLPFLRTDVGITEITNQQRSAATEKRLFNLEPMNPPLLGSDELKKVILKACSYEPKDRYQSAEEFGAALGAARLSTDLEERLHRTSRTTAESSYNAESSFKKEQISAEESERRRQEEILSAPTEPKVRPELTEQSQKKQKGRNKALPILLVVALLGVGIFFILQSTGFLGKQTIPVVTSPVTEPQENLPAESLDIPEDSSKEDSGLPQEVPSTEPPPPSSTATLPPPPSPTATLPPTPSPTATLPPTPSPTATLPPTPSPTATLPPTPSPTATLPPTPSPTATLPPTPSPTATLPPTPSPTATLPPTPSPTATLPPTPSPTAKLAEISETTPSAEKYPEGPDVRLEKAVRAALHLPQNPVYVEVTVTADGRISALKVGDERFDKSAEFGAAVLEPSFAKQFIGKSLPISAGDIDGITGATLTTNAVIEAVNRAYKSRNEVSSTGVKNVVYAGETFGFKSPIYVEVTVTADGRISALKVGDDRFDETPGYGANALEPSFADQFVGKPLPITAGDIDGISGATLTTSAVIEAVNTAYQTRNAVSSAKIEAVVYAGEAASEISADLLKGLTSLEVAGNGKDLAGSLEILTKMPQLQSLTLQMFGIGTLRGFEDLSQLTSLNLEVNNLKDITVLRSFHKLKWLSLASNRISDIAPLSQLRELRRLFLQKNHISDVMALAELVNLEALDLHDNQITDLSPLKNLANLEELRVTGNPVSDEQIDAIRFALLDCSVNGLPPFGKEAGVPALLEAIRTSMNVPAAGLDNDSLRPLVGLSCFGEENAPVDFLLSPLKYAENMEALVLHHVNLVDPESIAELEGLTWLELENLGLTGLPSLEGMKDLQLVHLGNNKLTQLPVLQAQPQLKDMFLANNQIRDITSLSALTGLEQLDLSGNLIRDVSALASLENLEFLNLSGNPLADSTGLGTHQNLQFLILINTGLSEDQIQSLKDEMPDCVIIH